MNPTLKTILNKVQKPGRYTGGELGCVYKQQAGLHFAFCFPDTYEVGMSYLGMKILYDILNAQDDIWCQRAFMPWPDMAQQLAAQNYPLYALESGNSLASFDILGFTLQYELSYTNILAMLALANIPLRSAQRKAAFPLVIAGGPCAVNAEPMAAFFDIIFLGEAEEGLVQLCRLVQKGKEQGWEKEKILKEALNIKGVYVPAFYTVKYKQDGTLQSISPTNGAPPQVEKAFLPNFAQLPPTQQFVVPMVGAVHDRAQIEVLRGCVRGCRFCQAGFIYRPARQRPAAMLNSAAKALCANTGYEEISLTSLSTSDHSQLEQLLDGLLSWTQEAHINLALPSLRVDNFTQSLVEKTSRVRKSGLTFAPEAGTQRLRDVINKNVSDEEIERSCRLAFNAGYSTVKLYFMLGLPTETMQDIEGIAKTAQRVVDIYYECAQSGQKQRGGVKVNVSVASFVPKPFTPFQYCAQNTQQQLREKQAYLLSCVKNKRISISYSNSQLSFLEAVFAKGSRRLADVIEAAHKAGACFDGWDEHFRYDIWQKAFADAEIDPQFYANRATPFTQLNPWGHLNTGVSTAFLQREYENAMQSATTAPCNKACAACGAASLAKGGQCFAYV